MPGSYQGRGGGVQPLSWKNAHQQGPLLRGNAVGVLRQIPPGLQPPFLLCRRYGWETEDDGVDIAFPGKGKDTGNVVLPLSGEHPIGKSKSRPPVHGNANALFPHIKGHDPLHGLSGTLQGTSETLPSGISEFPQTGRNGVSLPHLLQWSWRSPAETLRGSFLPQAPLRR